MIKWFIYLCVTFTACLCVLFPGPNDTRYLLICCVAMMQAIFLLIHEKKEALL